ncbi:MAG: hypothetical protein V1779_11585 [bacterium]
MKTKNPQKIILKEFPNNISEWQNLVKNNPFVATIIFENMLIQGSKNPAILRLLCEILELLPKKDKQEQPTTITVTLPEFLR